MNTPNREVSATYRYQSAAAVAAAAVAAAAAAAVIAAVCLFGLIVSLKSLRRSRSIYCRLYPTHIFLLPW